MNTLSGGGDPRVTAAVRIGVPIVGFIILTAVVGALVGVIVDRKNC